MNSKTFDIQDLVRESGVARRTIYFYVQQGLLPPPEGAGLAAHYNDEHLLRLRLIPVLRGQGLRLDEIRRRFEQMTPEEMQRQIESASTAESKPASNSLPSGSPPWLRESQGAVDPSNWQTLPPSAVPPTAERYVHYRLPAGIALVAPVDLSSDDRQRLNLLLQAAGQIFAKRGGYITGRWNGLDAPPDEE